MKTKKYRKALRTVEKYKECGNSCGHGCQKVFKKEDVIRTDSYGQTYYWCPKCYLGIKYD